MSTVVARNVRAAAAAARAAAVARRTHAEQLKAAVRAHIGRSQRQRRELSDVLAVLRLRTAYFRTHVRTRLKELSERAIHTRRGAR